MERFEKGQHVRFTHPRTGRECAGTVVRVDRNDRPAGYNVTIIETQEGVVSVPNALIRSFPSEPRSGDHEGS
jgi:hypothetical protein